MEAFRLAEGERPTGNLAGATFFFDRVDDLSEASVNHLRGDAADDGGRAVGEDQRFGDFELHKCTNRVDCFQVERCLAQARRSTGSQVRSGPRRRPQVFVESPPCASS